MKKILVLAMVICMLLGCCSCKTDTERSNSQAGFTFPTSKINDEKTERDNSQANYTFPTSKIKGEEAVITPSPKINAISANIEEVEPLEENQLNDNQTVSFPKDIEECFIICSNVVMGKVVSTKEFSHFATFDNTASVGTKFYSSLITFKVTKKYGNKPLKFAKDNVIQIEYRNCSYDYVEIKPKLEPGKEYILFLSENEVLNSEQAEYYSKDYFEYAPYTVYFENAAVLAKTKKGYDAGVLMDILGGKELGFTDKKPPVRSYPLEEIEAVIMDNIHNLLGIDFGEFLDIRLAKCGKI